MYRALKSPSQTVWNGKKHIKNLKTRGLTGREVTVDSGRKFSILMFADVIGVHNSISVKPVFSNAIFSGHPVLSCHLSKSRICFPLNHSNFHLY